MSPRPGPEGSTGALMGSPATAGWQPNHVFGDCSWRLAYPDKVMVDMRGEIDSFAIPSLSRCIEDVIADGHDRVVLDMAQVEFIDSVGMAAIVRADKRMAAQGGSLRIRRPSACVRKVLDIVGLTAVVPLED